MIDQYGSNIAINSFKSSLFSYYNRKFITLKICIYSSFRISYSFTIDEFRSFELRKVTNKSLARSGRKQATATKVGIYSTHSPRSSIHFLAVVLTSASYSNKLRIFSVQPGLRGRYDLCVGKKWQNFHCFFSPVNRW